MKGINNQVSTANAPKTNMDENRLYHLVFTGKISLKEYLLAIRQREVQERAA